MSLAEYISAKCGVSGTVAEACAGLLVEQEVETPRQLAFLSMEQLKLPTTTPGGKVAVVAEALEKAAKEFKPSDSEEGELKASGA